MRRILYLIILFAVISIPATRGMELYPNDVSANRGTEKLQSRYKITSANQTVTISRLNPNSFVMIFDASGRNVYKQMLNQSSVSIPVRQKGVYIIRITNGKDIHTRKILVN